MAVPKGLGSFALLSLTVLALLLVDTSDSVEHFCGGFMTFDFSSTSQYRARVMVITGWVLGLGPCGPQCSENDEGQPTHDRRLQIIAQRNQTDFLGKWAKETAGFVMHKDVRTDITDYVNDNIRGRVSSVNELLQWEQEIAEFEIDINPTPEFTDITAVGHSWRNFNINSQIYQDPMYVLQTKIRPQIRNDTGRPNNSPVTLYRPVYRIKINNVTQISIATSDMDGDLITCRAAGFVELDGISPLASTTIREDCVVEINASEQANFTDDSWGIVALVVEEYNRFPIKLGTRNIPAYDPHGLSSTILTFMIQAKTNLTLPEFVEPTPLSQHVYTVHAGSILTIPLYARPGHGSLPGTSVVGFDILSLPDHNMTVPDPVPYTGKTVFSQINWRTEDNDTGNFIIQVVAIDSESYESMDRSFVIKVKDVIFTQESATNENPYFPFFPTLGSFTCPQGSTCSFPIYAAPGQESNTIDDIHLLLGNTTIPGINMSPPQQVLYRGQQVYRSDVQLTSELWGNHSVCFVARDNANLQTEKCLEVDLIPPNPCDHQPCGPNSAACIPHGVTYECICKEMFDGVDCSILIDPCLTKNCKNNATCMSNGQISACICPPGFSGELCGTNIDDCHLDSCLNHGVCVDELQGFHCSCQPGYGGINCSTVPSQCRSHCSNGGVCIVENAQAVCQCPLTASGNTCNSLNEDTPINSNTPTSQPHFVVPTPRNGLQINCTVGETCTLPLFFKGQQNTSPGLQIGLISEGIIADISVPVVDEISGLPNTMTSSLSVTPQDAGSHHVCVELVDANSNNVDNICYEIQSQISSGPEEKPYILREGTMFLGLTLPDESNIVCLGGQPCHIIVQTDANIYTRSCVPVQSLSQGVFAFEVAGTANTCATDILLDTENPTDRICLRAGIGGEERCFTVHNIQNDPCDPNPCAHNGLCVNSPSLPTGYSCVCRVPYEGPNCSIVETTTSAAEVTTSHGHHDITCTESRMEFSIPLSSPHTSETATLSDPNCLINVTRTHVRGGVDLNSCGTTVQFQNDSVIFRNAIIFSAPESSSLGSSGSNSSVSQYQDIIPIQCVYNRIATVHLSYMPVVRRVLFTESGVGQFSFNIQQFWDASFTNMVSDRAYPLRMELDADVFIQLSVGSEGQPVAGHKEIGMEVQQCLVSPSSSVIEAQLHYYPLIQDGCPASSDVHIIPNTNASDSTVMRFRFRAVNFFDPSSSSSSSLVFVHCRMGLCLTGSCKPSAWSCLTPPARRVRRDVDQSKRAAHQLSTGPFLIMADQASTSSSSTTATVMAVVSTSVATVAIVIAAIALIALRRRRTTERN